MENNDLASIYKRLKKLLAMAEDTSSPQEAANAARMAETIMRKYQIEHADITIKELGDADSFGKFDVGGNVDQSKMTVRQVDKNLSRLAVAIAKLNNAQGKIIADPHFGLMLRFQGYKPDVEICKFMFRYILKHMQLSAKKHMDFSRDYQTGFIVAVHEELKKARIEKDVATSGTALVIVKADAVARHFGEVNYTSSSTQYSSSGSYERGYESGKQMDVMRRGVTTESKSFAKIK